MATKNIKTIIILVFATALIGNNQEISRAKILSINKHSANLESIEKKAKKNSPKQTSSTKKKSVKTKYQNGTLNDKIQIYEILPNPKGADGQKEWIKLFNPSNQNTNLGNWKIIQTGTAKPQKFILPDTLNIPPKSYLLISNRNLKFTLRNKNNLIELKNFTDATIDSIKYEKAAENQKINKKTNRSELQKNSSPIPPKTSIYNRLNLYQKSKAAMKQPIRTQNTETWLYFSLIPLCLLAVSLHRTVKGNLKLRPDTRPQENFERSVQIVHEHQSFLRTK